MTGRILIIAGLTIREAVRRKLLATLIAITVAMVALSAWGFDRLAHSQSLTGGEVNLALPESLVLFMFMFSFVVAFSATVIGSPSVSAEVESGVLLTIIARPIRRSEIILGKWLGLATMLAGYTAAVTALELLVVDWVSGFVPPNPVAAGLYILAEGALLLTVTVLLSTRLSAIAAGVVGVALFGASWLAGVVGSLGTAFNIAALRTIGSVNRYVLPTDGLWHGAINSLEPSGLVVRQVLGSREANPFSALSSPSWPYLVWVALWFLAVLVAGLVSFERREL